MEPTPGSQETGNLARRVTRGRRALRRAAFLLVFAVNVQCAASFVLWPDVFAPCSSWRAFRARPPCAASAWPSSCGTPLIPAVIASPLRFRALSVVLLVQQAVGLTANRGSAVGSPPATRRFQPPSTVHTCSTPRPHADGGGALGWLVLGRPGANGEDTEFGNHRAPRRARLLHPEGTAQASLRHAPRTPELRAAGGRPDILCC